MDSSERSFHDNLDLLIKLLRKLKDKSALENIPGMPQMFFTNFDFVINNYEIMKNQISDQLLSQFGEPIKQMVAEMVEQLKEEVGDEFDMDIEVVEEKKEPIIDLEGVTGQGDAIKKIDDLLKKPGLSEEEINNLLDERSKLKGD